MKNKVFLIGNVGRDPEIKYLSNGDGVANFSLATTMKYKGEEKTEWHKIVAFGKVVDVIEKYIKKGSRICVEGRLQTREWEDKNGSKHYTTEIVLSDLSMLGGGERKEREQETSRKRSRSDDFDDDMEF